MSESTGANSTTATMDMLVIVSSVLSDFFDQNADSVVLESSKILKTLVQNATKTTDDPNKEALYRRVRLANPKIQQTVTNVNGALDILSLAGFQETIETSGEKVLVYAPKSFEESSSSNDQEGELTTHNQVLKAICNGLDAKLKELEPQLLEELEANKKQKEAVAVMIQKKQQQAAKHDDKNAPSPFLNDEDRRLRIERAKAAKKQKEAERKATKERLEENKRERKEAAERREAALQAAAAKEATLATGISIRRKNAMPLAKPFEPAAGADPEAQRTALAAAARANKDRRQQQHPAPPQSRLLGEKAPPPPQAAAAASPPQASAIAMDIETVAKLPPPQEQTTNFDSNPAAAAAKESTPMEVDGTFEDKKPAARKRPAQDHSEVHGMNTNNAPMDCDTEWSWENCLERVPRCAAATGIRETSHFSRRSSSEEGFDANAAAPMCLKKLFKELDSLKTSLPTESNASIFIRFDEEMPQYIRALIAAPLPGPTPYSGGMFAFDMFIPGNYPQVPPKVQLLTTGGGKVRFGPNLYAEGKVCLSLLGTWPGPKWEPKHSSLYQVLISIQGLLLGVEHPYFLEPGHGGWEGQITEGNFQTKGQTLRGDTVQEEIGIPQKAVMYEDQVRVGTAKYAMLDILKFSVEEEESKKSSNKYLQPFADPIEAHFYQNGNQILAEVQGWLSDSALGRNRQTANESLPIDELHSLLPNLEQLLSTLRASRPSLGQDPSVSSDSSRSRAKLKKAPESPKPMHPFDKSSGDVAMATVNAAPEQKKEASGDGLGALGPRRQRMLEAAANGDFVLAGELQEEITRIEELYKNMTEAAAQQDFIRAGRLQAQFKALTASDEPNMKPNTSSAAAAPHFSSDESDDDDDEESDDESMDEPPMGGTGMALGGPPQPGTGAGHHNPPPPPGLGKWIFAPPSRLNYGASPNYAWGGGNPLSASVAPADPVLEESPAQPSRESAPATKSIPPDQLCRLRIRLPGDKSVVEDFDKNDILSAVYRRVAPKVEEQSRGRNGPSVPIPSRLVGSGAFAQPLSSTGFTLLLTRPKREFSLEMHGTKSLVELNLAPSATLTVMKCSDRGVLHRGELEARLRQAQGNAIDVEGLTYEALVELTERLGTAAPSDGNTFVSITSEDLESNSQTFSPAQYLAEMDDSMGENSEDERRCPICLGCYDATEETASLRQLNNCSHVFHSACLETWLGTKSSCPLCKTSIVPEA